MRGPVISAFSRATKSTKRWIALLKFLGINRVFLDACDLNHQLLNSLAKNKIKVFLEFGVFSNDPYLWKTLPQARVVGRNGKILKNLTFGRRPICPSNPKVRKAKLTEIDRVTKKFPLDTIFLDGLRFPSAWEKKVPEKREACFCPNCLKNFAQSQKIKPLDNAKPDWPLRLYPQKWYHWRTSLLVNFLKKARTIIKENNPKTKIGIFVIPLTRKEFDNAAVKIFGQDVPDLSQYADFISPMLYHRMCHRKPSWIKKQIKYFSRITKKPILPAIQTRDMPENLPNKIAPDELEEIVAFALSPPSKGVILFTLDNALSVFEPEEVKGIINQALL